jgi:hypothetical protein
MTKKAALAIAGGIVAAMVAGTMALTLGHGLAGSAASAQPVVAAPKPIIKTITKVVTIRKHAKAPKHSLSGGGGGGYSGQPTTVTIVRQTSTSGSSTSSSSSSYGDDSHEQDDSHGGSGGGGGDD